MNEFNPMAAASMIALLNSIRDIANDAGLDQETRDEANKVLRNGLALIGAGLEAEQPDPHTEFGEFWPNSGAVQ